MSEQDNNLTIVSDEAVQALIDDGLFIRKHGKLSLTEEAKDILLLKGLSWRGGDIVDLESIIHYNRDEEVIEVDPDGLIRLILIANVGQKPRGIKLVPRAHWWKKQPTIINPEDSSVLSEIYSPDK